jgi:hypothetical protein
MYIRLLHYYYREVIKVQRFIFESRSQNKYLKTNIM